MSPLGKHEWDVRSGQRILVLYGSWCVLLFIFCLVELKYHFILHVT